MKMRNDEVMEYFPNLKDIKKTLIKTKIFFEKRFR